MQQAINTTGIASCLIACLQPINAIQYLGGAVALC